MSILAARRQPPFDVATFGGGATAGLAFLLYFLTAARDIVVGDTPELITAAVTLGVPHPPVYPLFTMLGHLFSLLPFGPIPFRVNLLAVTCDALTVAVIFFTALRLSRSRPAAAIAALILAVIPAGRSVRSLRWPATESASVDRGESGPAGRNHRNGAG